MPDGTGFADLCIDAAADRKKFAVKSNLMAYKFSLWEVGVELITRL